MRAISSLMLLCCLGCDQGDAPEPVTPPPGTPPTEAPQTASPQEGESTVAMEVSWPALESLDRKALSSLSTKAHEAVARSRVPVLVADEPAMLNNAVVIARPAFTAVSTRGDGVTVSLHATRLAHRHPGVEPVEGDRMLRGHKGFVTQNDAIWSATWKENGVSYSLDVECSTLPDPRCADDAYLMSLVSTLRYVGGRPHAEEVSP